MCSVIVPGCPGVGPMTPPQEESPNPSTSITSGGSPPMEGGDVAASHVDAVGRSVGASIGVLNSGLENDPNHSIDIRHDACFEMLPTIPFKNRKDYCRQCGATATPQWRNGPFGPRTLCNACGIRLHRQSRKTKQKSLRVTKKIAKSGKHQSSPRPRTPRTPRNSIKAMQVSSSKSEDWPCGHISTPDSHEDKRIKEEKSMKTILDQQRPRRRAALVSIEATREYTRGIRRGHYSRWHPRTSRITDVCAQMQNQQNVPSPGIRGSMAPVDFTGAVDLVGLSRSTKTVDSSSGGAVAIKLEELGQDLLSHLTEIPESSMMELEKIEQELLSAHWEMQASEMAEQAMAKVLAEQRKDSIKKQTRYWRARDRLEKFIHANQVMK